MQISGIDIATVDTRAGSEEGENLLHQAGFHISSSDDHENKPYHLDRDASNSYLLREYKELLAEWKSKRTKS
jgi:hypothetical protein